MPEKLTGLIDRVTYHNPENGFAVLRVKIPGRADLITVIGCHGALKTGQLGALENRPF
jgi:exodeoxyribonuclease V alpha subunit